MPEQTPTTTPKPTIPVTTSKPTPTTPVTTSKPTPTKPTKPTKPTTTPTKPTTPTTPQKPTTPKPTTTPQKPTSPVTTPKPTTPKPTTTPPKPKPSATIQDKNLIESLLYLKQNKLLQESISKIKFETTAEAEDEKKDEIKTLIKEKTRLTKEDISELQKSGYNLHLESIKLIEVPLKTVVWLSTLAKKDLENVFKIFQKVNTIILPMKKENKEKIAKKEELEKLADQKEKQANQAKTSPPKPALKTPTKPATTKLATTKPSPTKPSPKKLVPLKKKLKTS